MPFKINHYPSRQQPEPVRYVYTPLVYYSPRYYDHTSRYSRVNTLRTKHNIHPNKFIPQSNKQTSAKEYHCAIYKRGVASSEGDTYHIVTNITKNRLDIISQKYYSTPILWWVIAQANVNIVFDPFNIPVGTSLRIPPLSSLYGTGGILDVK